MRLSSLASRQLYSLSPDDTIDKAISLMEEHAFHHLPVLVDGKPVGMVSDRDLLLSVGWTLSHERQEGDQGNRVIGPVSVGEIMSTPVLTAMPDSTALEAARLLLEHRIGCVVLTRGSQAIGIVTKLDLLRYTRDLPASDRRMVALQEPVEQHMRAGVTSVRAKETIPELARIMHDKEIRHLPVTVDRCLLGVISDRDVRRAIGRELVEDAQAEASGQLKVWTTAAFEIMNKKVVTVTPEQSLLDASFLMTENSVGALPVVIGEELAGIVTDTDIIKVLARVED
ncbi:MAG: CBS domain-containing protein [Phycisphaerae bacterium]